ncbi:Protein transport protein S9 plasma membrane t-SNARE [Coemansia spiralis]|uniref:Protein transport protein S9 plasma membrane t-SNARE n=2 Tax=Coemansia TaxID=4863 RepID=A0A9W8G9C2_9FUNG|nr:hypothetical protein BX070DRAFT_219528 [Coemansia spiralis]KAJ1995202.1 Protein transport protein S9 plasma membrane t-SNARE [Coemansia umbellata]KAJ2625603.1 Protein transport protein S9 plasma membrane t-SNARE [Coemansia sp. RSA 1358]KAJ2678735.1 Protein transport protein S9 plasma membrane t-SNARE [Coemansia spiralis]
MSSYNRPSGNSYNSYDQKGRGDYSANKSRASSGARTPSSFASQTTTGGGHSEAGGASGIRGYAASSREGRGQYGGGSQYSSRYQSPSQNQGGSYEDDEEDEVGIIKAKIREAKTETLESTRRALRNAEEAQRTGADTLARLGQQTEQIHNIDRTLELTSIEAENSVEQTSKLRTLNKSIFHVHIGNPFNGSKRRQQEKMKLEAEQARIRIANERKADSVHESRRRVNQLTSDNPKYSGPSGVMSSNGEIVSSRKGPSRSERSRYTFEEEDPEVEDEINSNIDQLSSAARKLKQLALATGAELKAQEDPMRRIMETTNKTSDNIGLANFQLNKIK